MTIGKAITKAGKPASAHMSARRALLSILAESEGELCMVDLIRIVTIASASLERQAKTKS